MKKRICAVMLCVVMTLLAGMVNMTFAADAPLENVNYEQNFDNVESDTLPAEWKIKEEGADITVRNGKKEVDGKEVDDTPALALGSAPWGDKITGTAYLDGYVWNKPHTLDCKILSRQDGDASGNAKIYLNYGGETCYVIKVKLGTKATLSKVDSSGTETQVAESAGNFDPWWYTNLSAMIEDGKIVVSLGSDSMTYEDSAIKPNGGIAFGADNITAFIDDISVSCAGVKENVNYEQNFDKVEPGTLPAEWKIKEDGADITVRNGKKEVDGKEVDDTPALALGSAPWGNKITGTAYLNGYVWNKLYTLDCKILSRQDGDASGNAKIYLNYGGETCYVIKVKLGTKATLSRVDSSGTETQVAESAGNFDPWWYANLSATIKDGKIMVSLGTDSITYEDSAIKPNGGIAFGADNITAFIDDISVLPEKENEDYNQNFNDTKVGKLPEEWKVKEDGADITVRNGKKEVDGKEVDDTPALALGSAPWGNKITGTAYLNGYVWNKPYTLDCKILSRQDGDGSGNAKIYLNYGGETCYVINVKLGTKATLSRVDSSGTETQVAESAGNFDPWWYANLSAAIENGKIVVSLGTGSITYEDSAIKPNGGIAFGADNITAFIDDISVLSEKENENYNQNFNDTEVGKLPSGWQLDTQNPENFKVVEDGEGNRAFLFGKVDNEYATETGSAYLKNYIWNRPYVLNFTIRSHQGTGVCRTYFSYNADEYYVLELQHKSIHNDGRAKIFKKAKGASEETLLATSERNIDIWNNQVITVAVRNGKITAFLPGGEALVAVDPTPIEGGIIGFGVQNSSAYFDNVKVTMPDTAVTNFSAYDGTTPITSLNGMSGKTLKVQFAVESSHTAITPIISIFGSDGNIYSAAVAAKTGDNYTAELILPANTPDSAKVKIFIWDGTETMQPYTVPSVNL